MQTCSRWLSLPADEYLDRMKAGWIGQMVGWGGRANGVSLGRGNYPRSRCACLAT